MFDILKKEKDWSKRSILSDASTASHNVLCSRRIFSLSRLTITYWAISTTMLFSTGRRYPFFMRIWVLHNTLQYVIPRWPIHITNYWCSKCRNTPGRSVQACTGLTMFGQEYIGWTECLSSGLVQEFLHSTVNTVTDLACLHPLIVYIVVVVHGFNYLYFLFLWVIPPLCYLC